MAAFCELSFFPELSSKLLLLGLYSFRFFGSFVWFETFSTPWPSLSKLKRCLRGRRIVVHAFVNHFFLHLRLILERLKPSLASSHAS